MIAGPYHYSTGMNGRTDYTAGGTGPLPPGNYSLHPYEISPAGLVRKFINPRDWGDFAFPFILIQAPTPTDEVEAGIRDFKLGVAVGIAIPAAVGCAARAGVGGLVGGAATLLLGGEFVGAGVGCPGGAIVATVQTLPANVLGNGILFAVGQHSGFSAADEAYASDIQACASIP